jgi:hypothetical protein
MRADAAAQALQLIELLGKTVSVQDFTRTLETNGADKGKRRAKGMPRNSGYPCMCSRAYDDYCG